MWEDAPDYGASLRLAVGGYLGPRERAIRAAADGYVLFARLQIHPDLARAEKHRQRRARLLRRAGRQAVMQVVYRECWAEVGRRRTEILRIAGLRG